MALLMLNDFDTREIISKSKLVSKSLSGGNSSVKRVVHRGENYAVKNYSGRSDGLQRLSREFIATDFCHKKLPHLFARPLSMDKTDQIAIFTWIDGIRPELTFLTVESMLKILAELHDLCSSTEQEQVPNAVDSMYGFKDLERQIENRIALFRNSKSKTSEMVMNRVIDVSHLYQDPVEVGKPVNTFSLSDFGAHNLLWDEKKSQMRCIDLEFFGVDDAHKLVCDTLLHPISAWNDSIARLFLSSAVEVYELDENRLVALVSLLAIRWSLIVFARAERLELAGDVQRSNASVKTALGYLELACVKPGSVEDIVSHANYAQLEI